MKLIECQQGTPEWFKARAGVITASMFSTARKKTGLLNEQQTKFVEAVNDGYADKEAAKMAGYKAIPRSDIIERALAGEKIGDWSQESKDYAFRLAIERISGEPLDEGYQSWQMQRGQEQEPIGRMEYESITGNMVLESGICLTDDGCFGYSTDGFVELDGSVEIKSLVGAASIASVWIYQNIACYIDQMQGGLWITGRRWIDFVAYTPQLCSIGKSLYCKRIYRDEEYIEQMETDLIEFKLMVDENERILRG